MPSDRPSRLPGGLNTQLVTAIIVALGIGGGGGSIIAHQGGPDLDRVLDERAENSRALFATKLEVAEMKGDLALIRQELAQVSEQLVQVSAQLVEVEQSLQRPPGRRR
jgi:hypothetical protein